MPRKLNHPKRTRMVLGVGLDEADGHVRITKGPDFRLYGGSKPTHEKMQELTLKARERLKKKGRVFATASAREVFDALDNTARQLGLEPLHDNQQS